MNKNGKIKTTTVVRGDAENPSKLPLSRITYELSQRKMRYFEEILNGAHAEATTGNSEEVSDNLASIKPTLGGYDQSLQNIGKAVSGRAIVDNETRPCIGHGTLAKVYRDSEPLLMLFEYDPPPVPVGDDFGIMLISMATPIATALRDKKVNEKVTVNTFTYTVNKIFTKIELLDLVFPKPEPASA